MAARSPGVKSLVAAFLLLTLAGCGGSQDVAVDQVVEDFYGAVQKGDGAAACAVLAPSTRSQLEQSSGKECEQAIVEEQIPKVSGEGGTEVFGTMARVEYADGTVFLTRFQDGWRVLAAGCTPMPGAPYDCVVKGG